MSLEHHKSIDRQQRQPEKHQQEAASQDVLVTALSVRSIRRTREHSTSFREFLVGAQGLAEEHSLREQAKVENGIRAWPTYDSGAEGYESVFRDAGVLGESFKSLLTRRKSETGQTLVLDVMGTGGFLPTYRQCVDGELAMTLVDHRAQAEKDRDTARGKEVIEGNVLSMEPWRQAKKFLTERNAAGFDLVICRPVAGWGVVRGDRIEHDSNTQLAEWMVVQRMHALVRPGGTLLLKFLGDLDYTSWMDAVDKTPGLTVKTNSLRRAVSIKKGENASKFLPRI